MLPESSHVPYTDTEDAKLKRDRTCVCELIQVFPWGSVQQLRCGCNIPIKEAKEERFIRKECLAREMAQQNSSFLSAPVVNTPTKTNLGEERIYVTSTSRSQPIIEESQGNDSEY